MRGGVDTIPRRMCRAFLLATLTGALTAQVVYVDPVRGVDQAGGGGANAPFKTMTYAATATVGPSPVFRLRPGTYDTASGEVFPIVLPDPCTVEGDPARVEPGEKTVRFQTTLTLGSTFEVRGGAAAGGTVFRDLFLGGGAFRGIQFFGGTQTTTLTLERVGISQSRSLVVNASPALGLLLRDCALNGPDTALTVNTLGGLVLAAIDRCTLTGGTRAGLFVDASTGGEFRPVVTNSRLSGQLRAVMQQVGNGARIVTRFEHCLFHDVGRGAIGNPTNVGALVDVDVGGGLPIQHVVVNSIFHANRNDAPQGTGANYAWGNNLVTQQNLVGLGGNVAGVPSFVDTGRSDWRLVAGSPGVDQGTPADTTTARDLGDSPRVAGLPDLGPFEFWDLLVESPQEARVGALWSLYALTTTATPFALVLASSHVPASFGAGGIHVAGVIVDSGVRATTLANGTGRVAFTVPNDPFLVGVTVYWQGVFATPPYLGANAWPTPIRS